MSKEIRYIEVYEQGTGKLLRREPYEVSDEELVAEERGQRMANLLDEIDNLKNEVRMLKDKLNVKTNEKQEQGK